MVDAGQQDAGFDPYGGLDNAQGAAPKEEGSFAAPADLSAGVKVETCGDDTF